MSAAQLREGSVSSALAAQVDLSVPACVAFQCSLLVFARTLRFPSTLLWVFHPLKATAVLIITKVLRECTQPSGILELQICSRTTHPRELLIEVT